LYHKNSECFEANTRGKDLKAGDGDVEREMKTHRNTKDDDEVNMVLE
jgi:hypothetical protein